MDIVCKCWNQSYLRKAVVYIQCGKSGHAGAYEAGRPTYVVTAELTVHNMFYCHVALRPRNLEGAWISTSAHQKDLQAFDSMSQHAGM